MNVFYENHRDESEVVHVNRSREHTYPSHFHRNIELFILKRGSYTLTVNGNKYEMKDGSVAFIDCYDMHSYEQMSGNSDDCVIIIPFKLSGQFNTMRDNKHPVSSVIHSPALCERLLSVVDTFIEPECDGYIRASAAELILSILFNELTFSGTRDKGETYLVRNILSYIQQNYRGHISRATISKALGYTPEHISRVFHKYVRRSLKDYINSLRMEFIEYRRSAQDSSTLTELIYLAGFSSEQTYYRAKRKQKSSERPS